MPLSHNEILSNISVLCIDDEETSRDILKYMLEDTVGQVSFAANGQEGLERYGSDSFDIIITDIMMPVMTGLEMTRLIRESDKELPIIVMTGNSDAALLMEAINSHISHFVPKPINKEHLIQILETYARNKSTEDKLSCNNLLLDQYKSVVDESTIVSKTDPSGKITYVNDRFCAISRYSEEELIGKSHNIIRHPDSESAVFEDMWKTIKKGETWHGIIKNRAKDGTTYIVDSTIKPIVNRQGKVIEYIGIRHDITEILKLSSEVEATQKEILYTLGELAESHSMETGDHVRRVAEYSKFLGQKYGLSSKEIDLLYHAAPMHDIGKMAVPDAILNKPDTLDAAEWELMKQHAEKGYKVFKNSSRELLQAASTIAHEHHERWDGSGYPRGLSGEEIHIFGRIVAIADVYDALGSDRVYKKAWEPHEIKAFFHAERGKQFDPKLVDLFLEHHDTFVQIGQTIHH